MSGRPTRALITAYWPVLQAKVDLEGMVVKLILTGESCNKLSKKNDPASVGMSGACRVTKFSIF